MNWKMTVLIVVLSLLLALPGISENKKSGKEKHKVQVSAGIIPVYVTDGDGAPVMNLKKKDFKLLINGRSIPFQFINHSITEKAIEKKITHKKIIRKKRPSQKVQVLILDNIFNSRNGMFNSKELMKKMIVADKGRHNFLIVQLDLIKGVKTFSPITRKVSVLMEAIDKITPTPALTRDAEFSKKNAKKRCLSSSMGSKRSGCNQWRTG